MGDDVGHGVVGLEAVADLGLDGGVLAGQVRAQPGGGDQVVEAGQDTEGAAQAFPDYE
jgi:hypothetical protein